MQLYTINATPVRANLSKSANHVRVIDYPEEVAEILNDYSIDGFTIYKVQGYWQGEQESSFKIEIASSHELDIRSICKMLRDEYEQDSVMLTLPSNTVEFI